ncbi:hypothetical protein HPB47_020089 [Ixodes persulcatus]|uniref:Uncharacterized protein n=1 Tax=Ixodes persulcatus TaxID=34615 RepID=A0AC60QG95_IXOPE|nr:hypothetical protein HPB47_020089 [Ixodes persulcatus]
MTAPTRPQVSGRTCVRQPWLSIPPTRSARLTHCQVRSAERREHPSPPPWVPVRRPRPTAAGRSGNRWMRQRRRRRPASKASAFRGLASGRTVLIEQPLKCPAGRARMERRRHFIQGKRRQLLWPLA